MTDAQLDKLIKRLDRRIMRMHEQCEVATSELSYVIGALKATRRDRETYKARWMQS